MKYSSCLMVALLRFEALLCATQYVKMLSMLYKALCHHASPELV